MQTFRQIQKDAEPFGERLGFRESRPDRFRRRNHSERVVRLSLQGMPSIGLDKGSIAEVTALFGCEMGSN